MAADRDLIVDVDEFKAYMRIEHDLEDDVIESILYAAQEAAEDRCRTTFDGDPDDVPSPVKAAIKLRAGYDYEHRAAPDEKSLNAMEKAFRNLLSPYEDPEKMF